MASSMKEGCPSRTDWPPLCAGGQRIASCRSAANVETDHAARCCAAHDRASLPLKYHLERQASNLAIMFIRTSSICTLLFLPATDQPPIDLLVLPTPRTADGAAESTTDGPSCKVTPTASITRASPTSILFRMATASPTSTRRPPGSCG